MIVFDRDGNFLASGGEGIFDNPHGIAAAPDSSIYCTDYGDHTIRRFSWDGRLLLTIGSAGHSSSRFSGKPFNRPTHVAISQRTGDLFISDGYGNARIHQYNADGRHVMSWGGSGIEPGHFVIPHNIVIDKDDNIYVADRECHRVQVFTAKGKLQEMWNNIWKPCGMAMGMDGNIYIGESMGDRYFADASDVGNRVSVYGSKRKLLCRVGASLPGEEIGQFLSPHGIAVDSVGDIYVADASWTMVGQHMNPPRELRTLQKLRRRG